MQDLLLIKPHSTIDVITNSSSEIFVCNTDKTIEFITNFLHSILDTYIQEGCTRSEDGIENVDFNSVFGKIYMLDASNVDDFIEGTLLGFGDYMVKELYGIPDPPDYLDYLELYSDELKYPYGEYREHNAGIYVKRKNEYRKALSKYLTKYGDVLRNQLVGTICVESASDNSIPYNLLDTICTELNAFRIHMG